MLLILKQLIEKVITNAMGLHWVHTVNILLIEHQVKIFSIHIMNIKPTIV